MTINEFAKLANVSVSTVSKIMNSKDDSISSATREKVLELAKKYNYKSAAFTTNPNTRSFVIGMIMKYPKDKSTILSGVLSKASSLDYSLLLRDSNYSKDNELKHLHNILGLNIDALLFDPVDPKDIEDELDLIHGNGIPYISLSQAPDSESQAPPINFEQMGYMATKALTCAGHSSIACLLSKGSRTMPFCQGYKKCLYDNNIIFDEDLIFEDEKLLIKKFHANLFTAVVVSHYSAAIHIFNTFNDLHYNIPEDLSIISLRNDYIHPMVNNIPIATLKIPYFEYGEYLAENLINILEKNETSDFDYDVCITNNSAIKPPHNAKRKKILSIGSINIDNYLSFDELPHIGASVFSSSFNTFPGGKCVNQAVGAAKLGHNVSIIGRVGSDADSDIIYEFVKGQSINCGGLKRTENEKTGQAYIFVAKGGDSMISLIAGANNTVSVSDIQDNENLFANGGYCLLQTEIPMPAILEASRIAKKHSMTTVLKPSACCFLPDELLNNVDILVPNYNELNAISPEEASLDEKASYYLSRGIKIVIVTMGEHGCYIKTADETFKIPAISITSIDDSGAGDAFISTFVSYLIYEYPIKSAAKIATYAAGLSTARQGTSPVFLDKNSLEAYIIETEPELLLKESD